MRCIKCGSENVNVQLVNESKRRGCLSSIISFTIKLILIFVSFILWIISLLIPKVKRIKTNKYAVCQNCGYSWKIK